jgi:hypothetical protein
MATFTFSREIPVRHTVDIFIAGGGPAGVAAGVCAARAGRRVFLAEGQACFGGMGTSGLVPAFMRFSDGVNFLAGGIGEEIYRRTKKRHALPHDAPADWVSINVEDLKRVYDDMVSEAGVNFTFQTNLIGVETRGGRVQAAVCASKSGVFAVEAEIFIDATGDGDLSAWAGAPFELGDPEGNMMPGTLCSLWTGIDWQQVNANPIRQDAKLEDAFAAGVFSVQDRHLPGIWQVGEITGGGNIGHTFGVDSTDERSLTSALVWGRKLVDEYERYYKEFLPGFERMSLLATGALLGIRESRRILGDYVLCLDDFKNRAVFPDEIGRYAYPVDIHASKPDRENFDRFEEEFRTLRYQDGESYGIPYRSLIPRGLENVLVAGRCLSSDRFLQGSVRVMPGCYITGQAAGMAAALAVEEHTGLRSLDVGKLQDRLAGLGAFLPNRSHSSVTSS